MNAVNTTDDNCELNCEHEKDLQEKRGDSDNKIPASLNSSLIAMALALALSSVAPDAVCVCAEDST